MSDYNQSFKSIGIDFFLHITLVHKAFDYNFFIRITHFLSLVIIKDFTFCAYNNS